MRSGKLPVESKNSTSLIVNLHTVAFGDYYKASRRLLSMLCKRASFPLSILLTKVSLKLSLYVVRNKFQHYSVKSVDLYVVLK